MCNKFAIVLMGTAMLAPLAAAQMRTAGSGFHSRAGMQHGPRSSLYLGSPYFSSDDFSTPVEVQPPAPQILVMQASPAAETAKEPKPEPLLIELQGDRYVRINASERTASGGYAPTDYAEAKPAAQPVVNKATAPATPLAPAVLVYRDGRRQNLRDYTIADGIIYARGDYWIDGYWNKKIPLNALDLPATMKASAAHGVNFVLPSSPNEVITRP